MDNPVTHPMEKTVPSFPLHPECPDLRRLADNPAEAVLRAEADVVAAENAAEADRYRRLEDQEEAQQDGRGRDPADLRRRRRRHRHRAGHRPVRHHLGVVRGDEDRHPDPRLPLRRAGRAQPGRPGRRPGAGQGPPRPAARRRLAGPGPRLQADQRLRPAGEVAQGRPARFRPGGLRRAAVPQPLPGRRRLQPGRPAQRDRRPGLAGQPGRRARQGHRVPQRRHRQHAAPLAGRHQRRAVAQQRRLAAAQRRRPLPGGHREGDPGPVHRDQPPGRGGGDRGGLGALSTAQQLAAKPYQPARGRASTRASATPSSSSPS